MSVTHDSPSRSPWCSIKMIAVQTIIYDVYLVRWWDWSNTVVNAYGTVSLHGAIVKITENIVIVNVYLQELCYILLVVNLWGITVKCTVYVGSLYLYGGPTSVTETVRLIVLLLYSYTICCFLLLLLKKVSSGWERVMHTLSVRRPQPHNTNL